MILEKFQNNFLFDNHQMHIKIVRLSVKDSSVLL